MGTFASVVGLAALSVGGMTVLAGGWYVATAGSVMHDFNADGGRSRTWLGICILALGLLVMASPLLLSALVSS